MSARLLIYGSSGHAKSVYAVCRDLGLKVVGFINDEVGLDNPQTLLDLPIKKLEGFDSELKILIGIGDNLTRKKILTNFSKSRLHDAVVHPSAFVDKSVFIGRGTVVMPGATINIDTKIGENVIINTRSSIDHDCVIEDFIHISPGATLAGNVIVKEGAWLGLGSSIKQGIQIGKYAVVGMGAVVVKNVCDNSVVFGVPAQVKQD